MTEVQTPEAQAIEGQEAQDGQAQPTAKVRAKAPDTSGIKLDDIRAATLAEADLLTASQPTRERSPEQKEMDAVAVKAYRAWVEADRPSQWQKIPVVTYFLNEDEVKGYRYLIRRACDIVEPDEGSPSVRVRFGNMFTLTEKMAAKIKHPELAGKTVLAWAAIEKRNVEARADADTTSVQDAAAKVRSGGRRK